MKLETYERAKYIREQIDHIKTKMLQIELMKKRDNDEEFTDCRRLAHDSLNFARAKLEQEFEAL